MKQYCFEFRGTAEEFRALLRAHSNDSGPYFCFDGFIVDLREDRWKFGVSRGGHSGGYWYIPEVTESKGGLLFSGTIRYLDAFTPKTPFRKVLRRVENFDLCLSMYTVFLPLTLGLHLYRLISRWVRKRQGLPPEMTEEEKLRRLMEGYLNCRQCVPGKGG